MKRNKKPLEEPLTFVQNIPPLRSLPPRKLSPSEQFFPEEQKEQIGFNLSELSPLPTLNPANIRSPSPQKLLPPTTAFFFFLMSGKGQNMLRQPQKKTRTQNKFKPADLGKNLRRDSIISDRTWELRILTRPETSAFLGSGLGSQRKNF